MGQTGQLPRAPTNSIILGGPHHKDNKIDLFRVVHFFNVTISLQATKAKDRLNFNFYEYYD